MLLNGRSRRRSNMFPFINKRICRCLSVSQSRLHSSQVISKLCPSEVALWTYFYNLHANPKCAAYSVIVRNSSDHPSSWQKVWITSYFCKTSRTDYDIHATCHSSWTDKSEQPISHNYLLIIINKQNTRNQNTDFKRNDPPFLIVARGNLNSGIPQATLKHVTIISSSIYKASCWLTLFHEPTKN